MENKRPLSPSVVDEQPQKRIRQDDPAACTHCGSADHDFTQCEDVCKQCGQSHPRKRCPVLSVKCYTPGGFRPGSACSMHDSVMEDAVDDLVSSEARRQGVPAVPPIRSASTSVVLQTVSDHLSEPGCEEPPAVTPPAQVKIEPELVEADKAINPLQAFLMKMPPPAAASTADRKPAATFNAGLGLVRTGSNHVPLGPKHPIGSSWPSSENKAIPGATDTGIPHERVYWKNQLVWSSSAGHLPNAPAPAHLPKQVLQSIEMATARVHAAQQRFRAQKTWDQAAVKVTGPSRPVRSMQQPLSVPAHAPTSTLAMVTSNPTPQTSTIKQESRNFKREKQIWSTLEKQIRTAVTDTAAKGKPFNGLLDRPSVEKRTNKALGLLKAIILGVKTNETMGSDNSPIPYQDGGSTQIVGGLNGSLTINGMQVMMKSDGVEILEHGRKVVIGNNGTLQVFENRGK